eukprot:scaffold111772_cov54-Phaeocystis_antarctica.AAC.3
MLPLRCLRDAQRGLLGGDELAQCHLLTTTFHLRLIGLGLPAGPPAALVEAHAKVARLASAPPPAPLAIARRTTLPPRRWQRCPGSLPCHRGSPAPGRAWDRAWSCRAGGTRRSSPSCCRPRVASASPPAPAAAPLR